MLRFNALPCSSSKAQTSGALLDLCSQFSLTQKSSTYKCELSDLAKLCNITRSLLDDINTKQLKWYGHVQRMEEGRLPKQVIKWSPPGRRKRGRPKLTWLEGIRGLMGEKGLVEEDWNDRDEWRKKIL